MQVCNGPGENTELEPLCCRMGMPRCLLCQHCGLPKHALLSWPSAASMAHSMEPGTSTQQPWPRNFHTQPRKLAWLRKLARPHSASRPSARRTSTLLALLALPALLFVLACFCCCLLALLALLTLLACFACLLVLIALQECSRHSLCQCNRNALENLARTNLVHQPECSRYSFC